MSIKHTVSDATSAATLEHGGEVIDLPFRSGTIGPEVIDVANLYKETGCFTYDPGFTSTANCSSKITYIDGDKGELLYRGYPIEQLAENTNFLAVCYLLLYGELPANDEFRKFRHTITHHTMLHEQMTRFYSGFRRDAHPMAVMVGVVGALSAFYHDSTDIADPVQRMIASHRLIAKMPTIAAMAYKYSIGQPFIYPRNDLDYTSNFLQMCFAVPCAGPHRQAMPAATQANGLAPEEQARRTVLVEAFCSWSACRMKMRSMARASTGLPL